MQQTWYKCIPCYTCTRMYLLRSWSDNQRFCLNCPELNLHFHFQVSGKLKGEGGCNRTYHPTTDRTFCHISPSPQKKLTHATYQNDLQGMVINLIMIMCCHVTVKCCVRASNVNGMEKTLGSGFP